MRLLVGHPASLGVVLAACAAVAAVFAFARPESQRQNESKMIDFSEVRYYSPRVVQDAFADQGIDLLRSKAFDVTVLSATRRQKAGDLVVLVGPKTGTGSFGPELEPYDERFGNVLVTYSGRDERLLERVESAVDSLR